MNPVARPEARSIASTLVHPSPGGAVAMALGRTP